MTRRSASRARAAEANKVGDPRDPATVLGPLVSQAQFDKVQRLIQSGIAEGATLVCGGPGRPEGPQTAAIMCAPPCSAMSGTK